MLADEDAVCVYHGALRAFYYPMLFRDPPYDPSVMAVLPR